MMIFIHNLLNITPCLCTDGHPNAPPIRPVINVAVYYSMTSCTVSIMVQYGTDGSIDGELKMGRDNRYGNKITAATYLLKVNSETCNLCVKVREIATLQ